MEKIFEILKMYLCDTQTHKQIRLSRIQLDFYIEYCKNINLIRIYFQAFFYQFNPINMPEIKCEVLRCLIVMLKSQRFKKVQILLKNFKIKPEEKSF